jgi:hypothetical protein
METLFVDLCQQTVPNHADAISLNMVRQNLTSENAWQLLEVVEHLLL